MEIMFIVFSFLILIFILYMNKQETSQEFAFILFISLIILSFGLIMPRHQRLSNYYVVNKITIKEDYKIVYFKDSLKQIIDSNKVDINIGDTLYIKK